jgi:protein-S-isoprenylcysteine O-methyltransferase Ste14
MPVYVYAVILAGTALWFSPFVVISRFNFQTAARTDRRARWGILLQMVGYSLLWQGAFWTRRPEVWRVVLLVVFLALANVLSWSGARALGRQLRLDAAVGADHELVRRGPYRWVRHPIYTSMLCVILGTGLITAPYPLLPASILVYLAGTEIRVRIEDGLLAANFGAAFREYRKSARRYIPFIW